MGPEGIPPGQCQLWVTEGFGFERTLKVIKFQASCHGQGHIVRMVSKKQWIWWQDGSQELEERKGFKDNMGKLQAGQP